MKELFTTFFKIGLFTFGGGFAMISLIESEVVDKHKWLTPEEFVDTLAIAQSAPGVFAVNISIMIGHKLFGNRGAVCASLGTALPSFLIILAIAMFFHSFKDNRVVAAIFMGLRPAVVALIAVPTLRLASRTGINRKNCWIPIVSALAIWLLHVSPVLIILLSAFGGYLYYKDHPDKLHQ